MTRHLPLEVTCTCGHRTRYRPARAEVPDEWRGAGVDRQQLLGPRLAALIVLLSLRYRLSRARLRELLQELTGLELSTGLIDQTLRQSAGQVAPLEEALVGRSGRAIALPACRRNRLARRRAAAVVLGVSRRGRRDLLDRFPRQGDVRQRLAGRLQRLVDERWLQRLSAL